MIFIKKENKHIKKLLEQVDSFNCKKGIPYYPIATDNKLTNIVEAIRNQNVSRIIDFWNNALTEKYFELPYPEDSNINTRAVFSMQIGMANVVLMLDEKKVHPWFFVQCASLIDLIIMESGIYRISSANMQPVLGEIKKLPSKRIVNIHYKTPFSGLTLGQTRPYHFFYDHLKYLYAFNSNGKNILDDKTFFLPKNSKLSKEHNAVFLFPGVIGNNFLRSQEVIAMNLNMEERILDDALLDFVPPEKESNDFVLWFGITGQKRSWLQQVEACIRIVNELSKYFTKIKLFVDGMTGLENEIIKDREDEDIYQEIFSSLKDKCEVLSLIGQSYRNKIRLCSTIDLFIANGGTGGMVPLRFCKKNGVIHSSSKLITFKGEYPDTVKFTDKSITIDVPDDKTDRVDFVSYTIPWQHVFNLSAEIINETKDLQIKYLSVPRSVNNYMWDDKSHFQLISSNITSQSESADILREVAFAYEKSGDIKMAAKIMKNALMLRPKGQVIKSKLDVYNKLLENV